MLNFVRYGLLFLGYRDGREQWELIIAIRKVAIVAIGTFGTLVGAVDLQGKNELLLLVCFMQ